MADATESPYGDIIIGQNASEAEPARVDLAADTLDRLPALEGIRHISEVEEGYEGWYWA